MATSASPPAKPDGRRGETIASPREQPTGDPEDSPKLPHERDESAKDEPGEPREVIDQARKDVERGLQDTDRGKPADEAYRKQQR